MKKKYGQVYEEQVTSLEEKKNYTNFNVDGLPKETYGNPIYFGLVKNVDRSLNEVYLVLKKEVPTYVIVGTKRPIEEYSKTELGVVTIHHVEYEIKAEIPKVNSEEIENMDQLVYRILQDSNKTLEEKIDIVLSLTCNTLARKLQVLSFNKEK